MTTKRLAEITGRTVGDDGVVRLVATGEAVMVYDDFNPAALRVSDGWIQHFMGGSSTAQVYVRVDDAGSLHWTEHDYARQATEHAIENVYTELPGECAEHHCVTYDGEVPRGMSAQDFIDRTHALDERHDPNWYDRGAPEHWHSEATGEIIDDPEAYGEPVGMACYAGPCNAAIDAIDALDALPLRCERADVLAGRFSVIGGAAAARCHCGACPPHER